MKNIFFATILSLLLSACAVQPTTEQLATADYGSPMSQKQCQRAVIESMYTYLKDPNSAKYRFSKCEKRGLAKYPLFDLPLQFGYFITAGVNAKNSYGAYTGEKYYKFLVKNGRVIRRLIPDKYGSYTPG